MRLLDIFRITKIKKENELLKNKLTEIGCQEYEQVQQKIRTVENEAQFRLNQIHQQIDSQNHMLSENKALLSRIHDETAILNEAKEKLQKQINTQTRKLQRSKELYKSIEYCISNFLSNDSFMEKLSPSLSAEYDELAPSILLQLHCMDVKTLRKTFRENDKQINHLLESYSSRYTTKANRTIYQLMVIALRAELQNILYNMKYEKLDQAIENVKTITAKYLQIVSDGNQSIAGTLTKFIGEIEYLFINAAKIEYNYYVKKEQARQEQLAIKEQMRQEAEERKALAAEKEKIEKEEEKYNTELSKLQKQLDNATDTETEKLRQRILELQAQLSDVITQKEKITTLQNGTAGNVYIISNPGSFGDNVFKIGMTRRNNPQERVNELGDASVPFKFDVHSFIFSNDAVALENQLHKKLNDRRVNKVNLRKEFFYSSIDELEQIVHEIDPTAEFIHSMVAEEFRQSISADEPYTNDYQDDTDENEY